MADNPNPSKLSSRLTNFTTSFAIPNVQPIQNPVFENIKANQASGFYDRLLTWISKFEARLDEQHEVGVRLVSFGQTLVFHLQSLGYCNPSLISFAGTTEEGDPVELIQHVSQISILLMRLPRKDPDKPKRPIGFHALADQPGDEGE